MTISYRSALRLCLIASFFSGVSALIYEIVWQKLLTNIIGSGAEASVLILATFLGGLGLGYLASGFFARGRKSVKQLLGACAVAEIVIGIWGVSFPLIYTFFWNALGELFSFPLPLLLIKLGITALCLGVPALFMGTTLPLLTQSFENSASERSHTYFYIANTAGAFIGAVSAGFLVLPLLSLSYSSVLAGAINLLCGAAIFAAIFLREKETESVGGTEKVEKHDGKYSIGTAAVIACLLGILTMTFQIITLRHIGIAVGSSEYIFGLTVAAFIGLIATGSYFCAGRSRLVSLPAVTLTLLLSLIVSYLIFPYWPYLFHLVRVLFGTEVSSFYLYHVSVFLLLILLLLVPVSAMGGLLPSLFWNASPGKDREGYTTGIIYFSNTLGSITGTLIGGYFAFYFFNLDHLFKGLIAGALILCLLTGKRAVPFYIAGVIAMFLPGWSPELRGIGLFHERKALEKTFNGPGALYDSLLKEAKVLAVEDGPITTATVLEFPSASDSSSYSRTLMVNGKSDGNTLGDRVTMRLLAHLPGLIGDGENRKAAVVGLGTGITLGSASLYPDITRLDSIEISEVVIKLAPYFDFANNAVSRNPKINWFKEDAFHYLTHSDTRYDLLIVQPSNPWLAGLERLYSKEFYELAKQRMTEKGIFTQWISLWGLSTDSARLILTTLAESFPHLRLFEFRGSIFILASKEKLKLSSTIKERFENKAIKKELAEIGIASPDILLSLERWIPSGAYRGEEIQTLQSPVLAYRAGLDFFQDASTHLESLVRDPADWRWSRAYADISFLAEWLAADGTVPDLDRLIEASCGGEEVSLVEPVWRYTRSPCRDALVLKYARGEVPVPEHLNAEVQWLRYFSALTGTEELQQGVPHAELYAQFDSVFIPLSEKVLLDAYDFCLTGNNEADLTCRRQMAKILIFTNRTVAAGRILETFPGGEDISELETYLTEIRSITTG